MSHSYKAESDL